MATDIILDNKILLVGGNVEIAEGLEVKRVIKAQTLEVKNMLKVATTSINSSGLNTKGGLIARKHSILGSVSASKVVAKTADIGKLNIMSTVAERTVPGKITIGTTTLKDKEINCARIKGFFFEGVSAKVRSLKVTGEVAGSLKVTGNITAKKITELSDARCKEDINALSNSLDKIISLQGVSFNWAENELVGSNPPQEKQIGFLAQDVEKILPEVVIKDSEGRRSLSYTSIIPLLVEGMKTQQENLQLQSEKIESKTQENIALKQKIIEIESKLDVLLESR